MGVALEWGVKVRLEGLTSCASMMHGSHLKADWLALGSADFEGAGPRLGELLAEAAMPDRLQQGSGSRLPCKQSGGSQ